MFMKFRLKVKGKGKIFNVMIFAENTINPFYATTDNGKDWEVDFEVEVEEPFAYDLQVAAPNNTSWDGKLLIITDKNGAEHTVPYLEWSGITGEEKNNISVRRKPIKQIPEL